jgi:photosystem II stability/assembly factor-like uncharacterized protein
MNRAPDEFDAKARQLTQRLLHARVQESSTSPGARPATRRLRAVGVLVAATVVVSVAVAVSLHSWSSSPSVAGRPAQPHNVPPAANPTLPPPTSVMVSCARGIQAGSVGGCVQPSSSMQFVSEAVGWLVGPRSVVATTDGGRHWSAQLYPHQPLIGADFLDTQRGWVVGARNLFSTQDGGRHWQPLLEPAHQLWSVHFVSATQGWGIVGGDASARVVVSDGMEAPTSGAHVAVTDDGGRTWQELPSPANVQSVCFVDEMNGWLGTAGGIYRSSDGGQEWQLAFAEPPASGNTALLDAAFLECAAPSSAWVVFLGEETAPSHAPYISFAAADGVHWRPVLEDASTEPSRLRVQAPSGPGEYPGPFSVVSPTTTVYFAWSPAEGDGVSRMVVTSEGGAVLSEPIAVPAVNYVISAAFISPARGWAVGEVLSNPASITLLVLATSDAGQTWSAQFSAPG